VDARRSARVPHRHQAPARPNPPVQRMLKSLEFPDGVGYRGARCVGEIFRCLFDLAKTRLQFAPHSSLGAAWAISSWRRTSCRKMRNLVTSLFNSLLRSAGRFMGISFVRSSLGARVMMLPEVRMGNSARDNRCLGGRLLTLH